MATHVISDSSSAYDEEKQEQQVWSSGPKPPDAIWEEGGNCEKAFWQKNTQPESYSLPFPRAQGWGSEFDQDNRSNTMTQPGTVAVIFHDAGKGPNSGEQDSGAEMAT